MGRIDGELSAAGGVIAYVNTNSQKLTVAPVTLPTAAQGRLARDRHPAYVYLARLAPGSRRTMAQALSVVAAMFSRTPETLDWAGLRYQHTQAIRAKLAETRAGRRQQDRVGPSWRAARG